MYSGHSCKVSRAAGAVPTRLFTPLHTPVHSDFFRGNACNPSGTARRALSRPPGPLERRRRGRPHPRRRAHPGRRRPGRGGGHGRPRPPSRPSRARRRGGGHAAAPPLGHRLAPLFAGVHVGWCARTGSAAAATTSARRPRAHLAARGAREPHSLACEVKRGSRAVSGTTPAAGGGSSGHAGVGEAAELSRVRYLRLPRRRRARARVPLKKFCQALGNGARSRARGVGGYS